MTALASRAPAWACSSKRLDPYYSHLWAGANNALWTDRRTVETYVESGGRATNAMQAMVADVDPRDLWFNRATGHAVRTALGAALMWRQVSCDQLAALTGNTVWSGYERGHLPTFAHKMVAASIAHVGTLPSGYGFVSPTFVRPGRFTSWRRLNAVLPFHEWLAITAGQNVSMGSQASALKHTQAMTELALRIAQWCPVLSVLGELTARHDLLVPELLESDYKGAASADAVVVTEDGGRIAIEMTVSTLNADTKVRRWVRTLLADRSSSLSVLFVVAPGPGAPRNAASLVRRQIESTLDEMGDAGYTLRSRFFVAEWDEWFPRPGVVSARFPTLPAQQFDYESKEWSWRPLLGDGGLEWEPDTDATYERAVTAAHACDMLYGTPFWLRSTQNEPALTERLDRFLVASSGFDSLPTLPYARVNRHDEAAPDHSRWLTPKSLFDDDEDDAQSA